LRTEQIIGSLKSPKTVSFIVLGLGILLFPLFASQYNTYLMLSFFPYAIILLGFNLLFGYTGLLTFGHALFVSLGAYTVTFIMAKSAIMYMELLILASIIISAVIGALIGILCVRYVKVYFAMLTLAFAELFYSFLLKSYYITGGDEGMRVLRPYLLGMDLSEVPKMEFLGGSYYYYAFAFLAIATFIMWRVVNSPFGLCLMSIRENPDKAKYLGINIIRYKWYAFIIASIYGAVGGALLAPVTGHVDIGLAYWTHSGTIVFMVLLGGFGNFFGPLLGAFVYIYLLDAVMSITQYWRIIFGGILAFIVIAAPGGLVGIIELLVKKVRDVRGVAG
jgi:branched-chain amino acid transport system permease protein